LDGHRAGGSIVETVSDARCCVNKFIIKLYGRYLDTVFDERRSGAEVKRYLIREKGMHSRIKVKKVPQTSADRAYP